MKYFSQTTGGFYTKDVHGDNIPSDAIEITDDRWQELLTEQSQGRVITVVDGKVCTVEHKVDPELMHECAKESALKEVDSIPPVRFYGFTDKQKDELVAYRAEIVSTNCGEDLPTKPTFL